MSSCASLLHKLSSHELCAEYYTSRVKRQPLFKDQPVNRSEVQEMRKLNSVSKIFYTLFCIKTKALVLV